MHTFCKISLELNLEMGRLTVRAFKHDSQAEEQLLQQLRTTDSSDT